MAWCQIECDCIRDVSFLCECVSVCVGFVVSTLISHFSVVFVGRWTKTFPLSISVSHTFKAASVTRII